MSVYIAEIDAYVNEEDLEALRELLSELREEAKKNKKRQLISVIEKSKIKEKYTDEIKILKTRYGVV